ncbi:MAG: hypothetical protein EXX96DRAFT_516029 [Benjaminiella poitrasii]|nr:MAG: hypothetical protein EXX96DRAFT_516029 [Benjaminiella poitrasii]
MSTTTTTSSQKRSGKVRPIESNEGNDISGRQRQIKRDEAIRKKLEQDLLKKKKINSNHRSRSMMVGRRLPGTVSALKPGQALTVKETMLVLEAAQLMAAKRCDCVLVVNDNDQLSGIFTAKDLAYRLVAEGLDAKTTPVLNIMTRDPLCVTYDTPATEALNLMVSKGFCHLPVCNDDGDLFGLLDITKCLYGALDKIKRAIELETLPTYNLRSALTSPQAEVKYRTNVKEIAVMMKELGTTAVLVTKHHHLAGIFTSKDIVLRVIAAGLNPENCTVVRVMTPNPDTAAPDTTVIDALKLMNEGHYLNLPVLEDGIVIGVVDVLKLTYLTLEQMRGEQGGDGPIWGRFWDSLEETSSQISDRSSVVAAAPQVSPQPSTSFPSQYSSDISPNESASMVNSNNRSTTNNNDDGRFTFKFTFQGQMHRALCQPQYNDLMDAVRVKVNSSERDQLVLSYLDDEEDKVLVSCDADVVDAVHLARKMGQTRVKLIVQDKQNQQQQQQQQQQTLLKEEKESMPLLKKTNKSVSDNSSHTNSNKLLLPAAIGLLGLAITGVIIYSKRNKLK